MKTGRLTTRFFGGPALRFQPDGRLVSLVRDGYESAFEEIFRRYGAALRSYAASIVTAQRADDVTQEAFTKAYLALRGTEKEIQLRPWLYRIVRNTALTNIRDEPRARLELELDERQAAGMSPEEVAEQREEVKRLMAGLRELPEPQRAAIVMRELEGLSHEQIAASLGLSGGAVRQSIYRARRALREGVGLLVPMPVLRMLLEEGFNQGASAAAAGGGAGIAVKTGVAALLAAGTVTTGAVLNEEFKKTPDADAKTAKTSPAQRGRERSVAVVAQLRAPARSVRGSGDDSGRNRGRGGGSDDGSSEHREGSGHSGPGSGGDDRSGSNSGPGPSGSGEDGSSSSGSGSDDSGSSGSGSSGSGSSGSGSGDGGPSDSGSGSGSSGSGSGGSGSDDLAQLDD